MIQPNIEQKIVKRARGECISKESSNLLHTRANFNMSRLCIRCLPFVLSLLIGIFGMCNGRPWYREKIPNGADVPNPTGGTAPGVGHVAPGGGGPRNAFGQAFQANGFVWTEKLCRADSDGDGRSNGEELGDPNCVWQEGQVPFGPALSHPGVADVVTDNSDSCSGYVEPDDAIEIDFTFTRVQNISAERTHYICEQKTVQVPAGQYHLIRSDIVLDNAELLHHMWIYLCDGSVSSDGDFVDQGSYSCDGMENGCTIVSGYAVGGDRTCEPQNVGAFLDLSTGATQIKIEAHYDNSRWVPQSDQSGIKITVTPTLRKVDAGLVILGKNYWEFGFEIPAGEASFNHTGLCPAAATSRLNHPVYVYSWNPHMHLFGKSLVTEHYRCGQKIGTIGEIDNFDFDFQQTYILPRPIRILPGDVLKTTCTYNTLDASATVLAGESTTEEMCDNYLGYYPFAGYQGNFEFFQSCFVYRQGFNPRYYSDPGFDVPVGEVGPTAQNFFSSWSEDPTEDQPACCATNTCDKLWAQAIGSPCSIGSDCASGICSHLLCASPDNSLMSILLVHASLMFSAWAFLFPLGIFVAMTQKHNPSSAWFTCHILSISLGVLLSAVGIFVISTRVSLNLGVLHHSIGVSALCFAGLQVLSGITRPKMHKNSKSKARSIWEMQHHWTGRIALCLGVVAMVTGTRIFELYSSTISLVFLIAVVTFVSVPVLIVAWSKVSNSSNRTAVANHKPEL